MLVCALCLGKAASAGTMPTIIPDASVPVPTASDGEKVGCSVRMFQYLWFTMCYIQPQHTLQDYPKVILKVEF